MGTFDDPWSPMLEATRRGFAVVPLGGRDGKRPRLDGWPQRGLATLDELRTWEQTWPGTNYGILTGEPSGVDVLDFDIAGNGHALVQVWARLEERIGSIPDTLTVATGTGLHVYIRHVPDAGSHPRIFGLPVDYLSTGRQAVGPGSVHANGATYRELEPGAPVAALPQGSRLVAALHGLDHPAPGDPRARGTAEPPKRRLVARKGVTGEQALERVLAAVAATGEGSRNDTLNREVYFLGPYLAVGALERSQVEEACRDAARRAGLGEREIGATLASACGDGIRDSVPTTAEVPLPDRACPASPALLPPRSLTRVRRRYQPLKAWEPGELTPALACIWRTFEATTWTWHGAGLDRLVFAHLLGLAQERAVSLEVEASLRYLSAELGAHTKYIGDALRRLQEQGWLSLARQGGPLGRGSVRAPSAYRLQVPARLAVAPPAYPRLPRAHQQIELSTSGSSHALGRDFEVWEAEVTGVGSGLAPVQERLGGDDAEIWGAVGEPCRVPSRKPSRSGRYRGRTLVGCGVQGDSADGAGGNAVEAELARVLAMFERAGLEVTVLQR